MDDLSKTLIDYAMTNGAVGAGISTVETLAGGPPSVDLGYVLKGARSAVTFALPLKQEYIGPYLRKEDHGSHNQDNKDASSLASGIAFQMAAYLGMGGHAAAPVASNAVYRTDTPGGMHDELPDISHRYLAAAAGVGHFGWSGNVIRFDTGAALVLGSMVTTAELTPTDPLPAKENYCDGCKLCLASCFSGFMDPGEKTTVTMGGREFTYSKRRSHLRCDYICGGFAGLHPSGQWSSWSASRYPIPDSGKGFRQAFPAAAKAYYSRPTPEGGYYHPLLRHGKMEFTCGHCMLVCHPDKDVRLARRKMLVDSGVVIQQPDGTRRAVSPAQAGEYLAAMELDQRRLYELID